MKDILFQPLLVLIIFFMIKVDIASGQSLVIQDLIHECQSEIISQKINGSCLRLGIWAHKIEHQSLYQSMEDICLAHVQQGLLANNTYLEPLVGYYPKCSYIYKRIHQSPARKNKFFFEPEQELKTLVRFLNSKP